MQAYDTARYMEQKSKSRLSNQLFNSTVLEPKDADEEVIMFFILLFCGSSLFLHACDYFGICLMFSRYKLFIFCIS